MANIYELTLAETNTFTTGAFLPNANSCGPVEVISLFSSSNFLTGSWGGLANTQNIVDLASSSLASASWGNGLWGGLANTQGSSLVVTESYDRVNVTGIEHPFVNQSMGSGEWDYFPIPPPPIEPTLPQRDTTRFRKAYSSQRMQPQRRRLIKR